MRAAAMFAKGKPQADVARSLGVSRESASRWHAQWKRKGAAALRGAGRAGRKPRLTEKQLRQIDSALRQGSRAHGFATDLWTLPRVAAVIEKVTGVRYHPGHAWRLLRDIGWSLQRPAKRARERNEEGVRRWKAGTWPALKKTPGENAPGSSSRTKAASPSSRRSAEPGPPEERRQS